MLKLSITNHVKECMLKETSINNIARCYANVFRGEPWNEAFVDPDGSFISLEAGMERWRQRELQLAYPLLPTAGYIEAETSKPDAVQVLLTDPNKPNRVIAFGWGYAVASSSALVAEKWSQADSEDQKSLTTIVSEACGKETPWYLSEVGVLPEFQGKRLGSQIVAELITQASQRPIVMRTNQDSPMTRIAANNGFEPIIGLSSGAIDPVNPERVLYIRRPQ